MLTFVSVFILLTGPERKLTQAEKERALSKLLGRKVSLEDKKAPTGNIIYKGKYMSFSYPAVAIIYTQKLNGKPIKQTDLESFIYDLDSPKLTFYTEVTSSPVIKSLADSPSVKLRQIESNLYSQSNVSAGGYEGLSFEKVTNLGNEKTAFFYVNGKIFSFSSQGSDINAVRDLLQKTLASLKFL